MNFPVTKDVSFQTERAHSQASTSKLKRPCSFRTSKIQNRLQGFQKKRKELLKNKMFDFSQFRSVQSLSRVRLFATPWTAARQASLSITNSRSSLKLMSIESLMPSSHLILCHHFLLLPPIHPSIRVFSNESTLPMRWKSTGVSA